MDFKDQPINLFSSLIYWGPLQWGKKTFRSQNSHLWFWGLFKILVFKVRQVFQYECTLHEALSFFYFWKKSRKVILEERSEVNERERCTSLKSDKLKAQSDSVSQGHASPKASREKHQIPTLKPLFWSHLERSPMIMILSIIFTLANQYVTPSSPLYFNWYRK